MEKCVFVLNKKGKPLMPTKRFGKVRRLLKEKKAVVVSQQPFVVRLKYDTTEYKQPLYGGIDPGRTNIGVAVINQKSETVYAARAESCNKDTTKHIRERREHRKASRRGERLRRKRRAKAHGTTTEFPNGRMLPKYQKPVMLKDIINTEAKFLARRRPIGWLTPTARHCVMTHVNIARSIQKYLPVTDWSIEYNKFSFMLMEDGTVRGVDFQNGRLKGYKNPKEYVVARQEGHCHFCKNGIGIDDIHHVLPKSLGGSDGPENLVGLCKKCHEKIHTGKKKLSIRGIAKKYAATSVLNQAMKSIAKGLERLAGEGKVHFCAGMDTAAYRQEHGIRKEHHLDAACIVAITHGLALKPDCNMVEPFYIRQFRNHDRARIYCQKQRYYLLEKKKVAANRNPACSNDVDDSSKKKKKKLPALSEWYARQCDAYGKREADLKVSRLSVLKSTRSYNRLNRKLPGTTILYGGRQYVLKGNACNGVYFHLFGLENQRIPSQLTSIVQKSRSLVYV